MNFIVDQPGFYSANDADVLSAIKKGFLDCHMAMWKDLGKIRLIVFIMIWIQYDKIRARFHILRSGVVVRWNSLRGRIEGAFVSNDSWTFVYLQLD